MPDVLLFCNDSAALLPWNVHSSEKPWPLVVLLLIAVSVVVGSIEAPACCMSKLSTVKACRGGRPVLLLGKMHLVVV